MSGNLTAFDAYVSKANVGTKVRQTVLLGDKGDERKLSIEEWSADTDDAIRAALKKNGAKLTMPKTVTESGAAIRRSKELSGGEALKAFDAFLGAAPADDGKNGKGAGKRDGLPA